MFYIGFAHAVRMGVLAPDWRLPDYHLRDKDGPHSDSTSAPQREVQSILLIPEDLHKIKALTFRNAFRIKGLRNGNEDTLPDRAPPAEAFWCPWRVSCHQVGQIAT
jgi:hypothetical protein